MVSAIRYWIPLAIVITVLSLFVYIVAQQVIRQSANDPQVEISEDLAQHLSTGAQIPQFDQGDKVMIDKSLRTFIAIYNKKKLPLASNISLDGKQISPPDGVFDYADTHGQNRLTWQPKPGVRSAIVVTAYNDKSSGYILVGRSLREVEKREDTLSLQFLFFWIITMAGSLFASFIFQRQSKITSM